METTKNEIYNLWVKYTTKNEETFFRQFIVGFVSIWENQLNFNFDDPPPWSEIKNDSGPHLNRLPDELLPAIGKFIFIARDEIEQGVLQSEKLLECELLLKCLMIISRHFDNIPIIAKTEYITNSIAIATLIIKGLTENKRAPKYEEITYIKSFGHFLEVLYDPYLSWRNFLNREFVDFHKLATNYHATQLNVEIVPFIYDCFQDDHLMNMPETGTTLIHILGAIISGSQIILATESVNLCFRSGGDGSFFQNLDLLPQNGLRAICPATVSILISLLSKWECCSEIRKTALNCFTIMNIVLQRSSPEHRQIEMLTILQLYLDSIRELLKTDRFTSSRSYETSFEISQDEEIGDDCIDVNALGAAISNVGDMLCEPVSRAQICGTILEANFIAPLIDIPRTIQLWKIDLQNFDTMLLHTLITLTRTSDSANALLSEATSARRLFDGIKMHGKPSLRLVTECLKLGYDFEKEIIVNGQAIVGLVEWIVQMGDVEQNSLSENLVKILGGRVMCKTVACKNRTVEALCLAIADYKKLTAKCIIDFIKCIEELGKHNIHPIELKSLFELLRSEVGFDYRKQLLLALSSISYYNLTNGPTCVEYLDIQNDTDGITVPDIRKWLTSGSHGFIFHTWIRLDNIDSYDVTEGDDNEVHNYRRQLFNLTTVQGTGFEFFIQKSGDLIVGVATKKEYLTATAHSPILLDGRWHSITVSITPPKRPFSYNQVNIYVDSSQKLGVTMKFPAFSEPFYYCTIGTLIQRVRRASQTTQALTKASESPPRQQHQESPKIGMFPSFIEKTFLPSLFPNVPSYLSLPMRNTSSLDPNVKSFPSGMQESIFGEPCCLKGQLGYVVLAEASLNVKSLFDAGPNLSTILLHDYEQNDLGSRYVFCFSPSGCYDGYCIDLAPGNKYNGHVVAKYNKAITIQESINSIGGTFSLLPLLEYIVQSDAKNIVILADQRDLMRRDSLSPVADDFVDWEVLPSTAFTEWKLNQNPVSCFICLVRNFINGHELNQENLLKNDAVSIIGSLLTQCNSSLIDVHVLMSVQLLIESIQNQMSTPNVELLQSFYSNIVFNFKIWSKTQFQITIGHIQYICTIIKDDRKFFRKKYGIQFFLDTIRQYYPKAENLSLDDAKTIRVSLLGIIKYYIQKEINMKEVTAILSFIASVQFETLVIEILEMLTIHMSNKLCKDQIFLLMHEPLTTELLYALMIDKNCGVELQTALLNFISCLLNTKRVSNRHKSSLRLADNTLECHSLYPGLFNYMFPLTVDPNIIIILLDQTISSDSEIGYSGTLSLIHHLSLCEITLKLEVARRLLTATFTKLNSPSIIAKQNGWQESIARLLIKKAITGSISEDKDAMLDLNFDEQSDILHQNDLMTFDEKTMELNYQTLKDSSIILTERLQASVTEAANVIESEIKELADSVSEKVVDNFTSVYSVIRQKTHDIHDTLESLAMGGHSLDHSEQDRSEDATSLKLTRNRSVSISSNEDHSSLHSNSHPPTPSIRDNESLNLEQSDSMTGNSGSRGSVFFSDAVDKEEQLVYLVTNILFTVLWRGVENNSGDSWKERGQVMACINLLGLNNELYCSHLTLRLRILEMGVQAALIDLGENGTQTLIHQQNAAQLLRMVYDLAVLDPNEDDSKKCSIKLLDGVLAILDALMVFQQASSDDWLEMTRLCLGLLLKCSHNPDPDIVAMATAKLHGILQTRNSQDPQEIGYLIFSINKALEGAIEIGNSEQYSFLMPVLKALLEKSRQILSLNTNVPDLPPPSSGPVFFHNFQMYSTTKQWINFVEKKIKPLHDAYQKEIEATLWEPLNIFWAECYEACKNSSQKRARLQMESRRRFQQKILLPWRIKQSEELARLNNLISGQRAKQNQIERRWKSAKRFLHGQRGAWRSEKPEEEFWKLSRHENTSRMRLKLEPSLYHDPHTAAANLRDNTVGSGDESRRLSTEFGSSITAAAVRDVVWDEDSILLEEEIRNSSETQQQQESINEKEKLLISQECELVTLMTKVKGRMDITTNFIIFTSLDTQVDDKEKHSFRFPIAQLREIHLRKYNLRRSALEIFLVDQTSYFLNFTTKTRNKIFSRILGLNPPNILYGSGRSPSELLKASGLTQKWINREISNFDYLMNLNTIAGRSYNDLSQYPVFPWILADYTSDILDLTDPRSFRNLHKPIGVVNPKNEAEVRAKFDGFEDPSGLIPKFHYGTHYSNSAGVLHYMIRVEPFTSLHIDLQSGRFDVADRQFHSIPQTWKLLMDNPNDVKELIPEFFYFPEFLKNTNKFDLGVLQVTKERVEDVILPKWAKNAEDFIAIHRRALESEYVSQNLHHWIDLIFGYKQKGPKAAEALNVFYYCSYEGAVDLDKITNLIEREAVEGMINNFGQIPSQLMREPHPRRSNQEETIFKLLKLELKKPDCTQFLDRIVNVNCEMSTEKDPIIYLSDPRSPPRSFLQTSPDMLISITKSGIIGCHSWMSHDKDKGFILEIDATTLNLKNRKRLVGPFHPAITLNSQLFAVSLDGKYLYSGGIWDNSLRVFNINRNKMVATVIRHSHVITCIALDNCGFFLVTGSKDCTCIVWSINNATFATNMNAMGGNYVSQQAQIASSSTLNNNNLTPKPINVLYGHDDAVICVAIMTELDMIVSGSQDGTVNVHTIHEGQFIRTLNPLGCTGMNIEISFITISYQGHIIFSALDDTSHSVHVFSINGTNLGSKYVSGRVTGLSTAGDCLVVADDAGDLTMSRLNGLKPVFDIPLHIPVQTVVVTPGNTHMLSPLRDGRLAVVGVSIPSTNKKHSVLNV